MVVLDDPEGQAIHRERDELPNIAEAQHVVVDKQCHPLITTEVRHEKSGIRELRRCERVMRPPQFQLVELQIADIDWDRGALAQGVCQHLCWFGKPRIPTDENPEYDVFFLRIHFLMINFFG